MREKIVFEGNLVGGHYKVVFEKPIGCFQTFDPRPEPENISTENSCDPARNKDLEFWMDYLKSNPKAGKVILEEYFASFCLPGDEPLFQWDFLNTFNLTIPDTVLSALMFDWSWEQTKAYLQKQMDSGVTFTLFAWREILIRFPQAAELPVPWNDFSPEDWMKLLKEHVQFADRCVCFERFLPEQWVELLAKHPELECRGVCFEKFTEKNWEILSNSNNIFLLHKENWLLRDELRPAFFLKEYFIKHRNFRIGLKTAAHLCYGEEDVYQIRGADMETGLPKPERIEREEIKQILEPFCKKQEDIFRFLSSGRTEGILPEILESMAHEFPVHNRNELEILLAIGQPGHLMYWNEYKENRPCRLEKASEIARQTRGVLLYKEQQEQALELLTGCSPDEAIQLRAENSGGKFDWAACKELLKRIARHCRIPMADAEKLYDAWHYYTGANVRHSEVAKVAYGIYLRALEHLRNKGEIPPASFK